VERFAVGHSVIRKDAYEKASGASRFLDDLSLPGMLFASTVRASTARGTLKKIDTAPASELEEVEAVLTASDVPGKNRIPFVLDDYPFLAEREIRFHGQPVAVVAARTAAGARHAAGLVQLEVKPLTPLLDMNEAMKRTAPKLHGKDNVFSRYRIRKGDAGSALKKARYAVKGRFETGHQMHAYLETNGVLAVPEADGSMTVMGSMQCPFYVRDAVCAVLGLVAARVRIVQTATGGAFGGKEDVPSLLAGHAALLAHATGRPVKLVYSREEDFASMSRRHPSRVTVEYGADRLGKLTACRVKLLLNGGAYATLSPIVLWRASVHAAGPYDIPNVHVDTASVATNTAPAGAFRGFGQPQASFAGEGLIDELAREAGIDPVEFRLKNALRAGSRTATKQLLKGKVGLVQTLKEAKKERARIRKPKRKSRLLRGVGVASSFYGVGLGAGGRHLDRAGAFVQVMADGSVTVAVGNTEMGQGARTVLAQIAAEALNAPLELVDVGTVDTSRVPDSGPTVASRTTVMSGNAVLDACKPLRDALDEAAASLLKTGKKQVIGERGGFRKKGGKKTVPYEEVAADAHRLRRHMASQGWFCTEGLSFDPRTGLGDPYPVYTYSTHLAEVEADPETGEVRVLAVHSFHDIGTVVNPREATGQCMGGILQGIGFALTERLPMKDGALERPGFASYTLPGSMDAPRMSATFVDGYFDGGPFGAKGLGESALLAVPGAVANALSDALGKPVRRLPATPEILLGEMSE